ncbi:membrane dipeptidase [Candidatus Bathyarchaeota archaeon]|nr:membrane dipeptidase [Candidatus Bathyarchaeota archaeon]
MPRSYLELSNDEKSHAQALHKESIVIDSSIVTFLDYVAEDMWIDDVQKGGLTASNATVCMQRSFAEALKEMIEHTEWAQRKSDRALIVKKAADIEKAKREGKHGVIFGPQDTMFLERNLHFLKTAHDYGLRIMQLTYNYRNEVGDGCMERCDAGLSNFGVTLVEEMNRLGVLIDLSHTGDRSSMDAIETSKQPVSFTHIIPRSTTPEELGGYAGWVTSTNMWGDFQKYSLQRGKTDEVIKACAEKGGVIGVTPFFAKKAGPSTLTDDLMDQVDATVELIGVDHVGFGSDLEYPNSVTRGCYIWRYPDRVDKTYFTPMDKSWGYGWMEHMPNFTMGLVARGYSDQEIKKILGLNWVRLFKRVWGG